MKEKHYIILCSLIVISCILSIPYIFSGKTIAEAGRRLQPRPAPKALIKTPPLAQSLAVALRFSPDSQRLITAGALIDMQRQPLDKRLRVWDVGTGREIGRLPAVPINAGAGAFYRPGQPLLLPDFKTMLTTWGSWEVKPVNIHSFHISPAIRISCGSIGSLALSPDNTLLAVGTTGAVEFRDARTYRLWRTYAHGGQGTRVHFGPDAQTVACFWTGSRPQTVDVATGRQIPHPLWFYRVRDADAFTFSQDGQQLAKATGQTIEIWQTPSTKPFSRRLAVFHTTLNPVRSLAFSPDGKTLAVGGVSLTPRPVEFIGLTGVRMPS